MGREERWSEVQHLRGQDYVLRTEADALADAADIYAVALVADTGLIDEQTAREKAAPFISRVAGDAVARHERRYHKVSEPPVCPNGHEFPGALVVPCEECQAGVVCIPHSEGLRLHELLSEVERVDTDANLLAQMWVRSSDETTRRLGADLLQVLNPDG